MAAGRRSLVERRDALEAAAVRALPAPALRPAAVYFGDNGRALCADPSCAGMTALYSGHDLSGLPLERATVADVAGWPAELGALRCECFRVALVAIAGPDGWPLPRPAGLPEKPPA